MADKTAPSPAVPDAVQILDGLRDALRIVLDGDDLARIDLDVIDASTRLLTLPVDSLALMATMSQIEDRFRVFISEQQAQGFTTVGDIIDYVQQRAAAKAARRGS